MAINPWEFFEWNFENADNKKNLENRISSLENQIIEQYRIPYARLTELATFSAEKWKEELRAELEADFKNRWEQIANYDDLSSKIQELWELKKSLIERTKAEILWLKEWIEISSDFNNPKKLLVSKIISKETLNRCENPQNMWDQILWLWVWTLESIAIAWKFSWEVCVWIAKAPYHLWQLARGKWEYDWTKKI